VVAHKPGILLARADELGRTEPLAWLRVEQVLVRGHKSFRNLEIENKYNLITASIQSGVILTLEPMFCNELAFGKKPLLKISHMRQPTPQLSIADSVGIIFVRLLCGDLKLPTGDRSGGLYTSNVCKTFIGTFCSSIPWQYSNPVNFQSPDRVTTIDAMQTLL
jgi:hypothetical protein